MIEVRVSQLPGADPHLIGATLGQQHAELAARSLPNVNAPPDVALLDFSGTTAATASYIKAFVFGLVRASQDAVVAMEPTSPPSEIAADTLLVNCTVLLARVPPEIGEELAEVCASQRVPVYEANAWDTEGVRSATLHGPIDRALWETLDALARSGPSTATSLNDNYANVGIKTTGWNNRLAELYRSRLVLRERRGRQFIYAPVAREVRRG